ncbi:hypothetical protein Q7C_2013 [Methylophaga frappieri]|uniref:Lipoprotein n=1 Tax=Methylophaga frappieri (strain ATCC BAA-2434 / DSM 25690 / JAM7) TaxID=754477 RepID=I1YJR0_METFJ|nr:hypothetical protein [Methylophaga frappieri]AFJ03153.1 hypothetical protein Q7C_2013 [Methylophaga frappieri]
MRGFVKYSGVIALGMTMLVGLSACGGSSNQADDLEVVVTDEGKILWETGLQYVKVVERDAPGEANQHPYAISQEEMRDVLNSMYVTQRVLLKETQIPLFSPGEVQTLSSTIARGLGMATTGEDVTFVTLGVHQGALARERNTNSGRVFIDSRGRLNIIFGLLQAEYRDKDQFTGQEIDRRVNPLRPGSRRVDANPATRLALDNGQAYYTDPETGEERNDWVVIDIPTVLATMQQRRGDSQTGTVTPALKEQIDRNTRDNQILREDMTNIKEILFEMSAEIEALREDLKAGE